MSLGTRDPTRLILRIHAAPLEPETWTSILEELRVALNARGAMLHTPQVRSLEDYWSFETQFDRSAIAEYARDWMSYDVWAEGARKRRLYSCEGLTCVDDALIERRAFRRSAFFHDFLRKNDIDRMVTLNLHRGRTGRGIAHTQLSVFTGVGKEPFSTEDVRFLDHLTAHLLVASRNYCSIRALAAFNVLTEHALDGLAAALFVIDRFGRPVHASKPAEAVLRGGEWLALIEGNLSAGNRIRNAGACAIALKRLAGGVGTTTLLEHARTGAQRPMLTTPVGTASALHGRLAARAAGLVWLLPSHPPATAVQRVAELFELTPAETRLLAQLARADNLKAAAEQLNVSWHTARNQLKAILRKSGRRSQTQLLSLVNRIAAIVANSAASEPSDSPE